MVLVLFIAAISFNLKAQVKIEGIAKNFKDSIFYISETGGFHNFTREWRDNKVKVIIDKNQRFKAVIPEESIGTWLIRTNQGIQIFDIIKGKDLEIIADFSSLNPFTAFGKNADDFNYYSYIDSATRFYLNGNYTEKTRSQNLDSALAYRKSFSAYKIDLLNKYKAENKMSDVYYRWVKSKYVYEPYERTLVENLKNRDSLDHTTILKILQLGVNDEYAAIHTPEYNDLVEFFVTSRLNETNTNLTLSQRFNLIADGNLLSGSTKDVYLSRFMTRLIKSPDSIYNPLYKKYDLLVNNEKMKKSVIDRRNDYASPTSNLIASGNKVISITEILKKYKGKIVYIDFWASWCIPCRAQMPNAAILKEKLKGKDIAFLYFGYNDKERAWLKARDQLNIEGDHYFLTEKAVMEADMLFGINGIPHYVIINKDGKIINKQASSPGEVYQELFNLLRD